MSHRELSRRYWDAYEASLEPPQGSAARNLARLEERLEGGEKVTIGRRNSRATPRAAAGVGLILWGKAGIVSVGLGIAALISLKLVIVGWAVMTDDEPSARVEGHDEPSERAEPRPSLAPRRSVSPRPAPSIAALEAPQPKPISPKEVDAKARAPQSRIAPRSSVVDTLRAELSLMERARRALVDDADAELLWRLLDEHGRRFPHGAMTEERDAWRAVAACRLGREGASRRARRFFREYPDSAQASRVGEECIPPRDNE